ncbi:hypothetical protein DB346_11890 [Verrucomicrobia bacterium LW23]|nr:hypothetical protein DB346_11890 [Verrucomicrobia bacterium LW23]
MAMATATAAGRTLRGMGSGMREGVQMMLVGAAPGMGSISGQSGAGGKAVFHIIDAFAIAGASLRLTFSHMHATLAAMFLIYRNRGDRRYGREPIAPHPRRVWEFQFITCGSLTVVEQDARGVRRETRVTSPTICVTGPECVHGWSGTPDDVCHAIIFHFDEIDFSVRSIVGSAGCRLLPFAEEEVPTVRALYQRCAEANRAFGTSPPEAKKRAGFFEPLIYTIVGAELALIFLRHVPKEELGPAPNYGEAKVTEALAWYEANLVHNPTIEDVARAVHMSSTHLRRLFHKLRGTSPQAAFTEVQFRRVKWLMRDSAMTLERIAECTGFGSASAFSRCFAKEFGMPPNTYRKAARDLGVDGMRKGND